VLATQIAKTQAEELKAEAEEIKAKAEEVKAKAEEVKAKAEAKAEEAYAIAKEANAKAKEANAIATEADAKAEKKLRVALTALESLGINRKNCAISASDERIRDALEKIRSTMSKYWTASEFIEIHNKLAAEYNAKHSDKIETIFPALVNPCRLIELIENDIPIRVIERLENGNLHVVIPLGTGVDENTGNACIVAISSNIKGQEATRDISLEKLNFTGKGIMILVQAKDSKSIKEEEKLSKEYFYSLTGVRGLLGNSVVPAPAENNDGVCCLINK